MASKASIMAGIGGIPVLPLICLTTLPALTPYRTRSCHSIITLIITIIIITPIIRRSLSSRTVAVIRRFSRLISPFKARSSTPEVRLLPPLRLKSIGSNHSTISQSARPEVCPPETLNRPLFRCRSSTSIDPILSSIDLSPTWPSQIFLCFCSVSHRRSSAIFTCVSILLMTHFQAPKKGFWN